MKEIKEVFKSHPEILNALLFVFCGAAIVYLSNHFFSVFAPFVIAYVVTRLLHPLMVKIRAKIKIPKLFSTLLCLFIFVIVAGLIIWVFGYYIVEGVAYLIDALSSKETINTIVVFAQNAWSKFENVAQFLNIEVSQADILGVVSSFATKVISALSNFSLDIAMKVPTFLTAFVIGSIAAFYMLHDYDNIASTIKRHLSPTTRRLVCVLNNQVLLSFFKMILSYVLISAICFCEQAIGFWIIGIKDALFMALIIAIFDVLPVVGSGAILIPWGIISLLTGNLLHGIGLILLWVVIVIVRQILEPKIVGTQIGLHPLVTLASLYIGLRLMGVLGLVAGPLYVMVWKKLSEEKIICWMPIKQSDATNNSKDDRSTSVEKNN